MLNPLAGSPVPPALLQDIPQLISQYYLVKPNLAEPGQGVTFGTSGHRGTSLNGTFTESHILAIAQAICDYRREKGITGPIYLGKDTHALSHPAYATVIQVLAANQTNVFIDEHDGYTPTPVVSHAILCHNRNRKTDLADGIIITPSHNPPSDGGIKYNPPNGGPADTDVTSWIANAANQHLKNGNRDVAVLPYTEARKSSCIQPYDYVTPYVEDLANIIDMDAIARKGINIGVDALGGAGLAYWRPVAKRYGFNMTIRNDVPDPTFRFMHVDHDGRIRMDCSSKYAMASLIVLRKSFDIAFGNDPDFDRHGIVTPDGGLMNPNAYLAAAIHYLFSSRNLWKKDLAVGKTVVSSSMIDRVAARLGRTLYEVPVGFKWFAPGLFDGSLGFGGEESAGASFLRKDGTVWSTDKDGIIMALLAAEILAVTGLTPSQHYAKLCETEGVFHYARLDQRMAPEQMAAVGKLSADSVTVSTLGGSPITAILTQAPGNGKSIGGVKIITKDGWAAIRPSGTEPICKIYAESQISDAHLTAMQQDAAKLIH